jgi:glycosyltransferase involved in cell wall biosynthesis
VPTKTRILIVGASPILPTGMGEVIRLTFGALLDKYPDQYDLHQVGLFHSHAVATPRWPVYPTSHRRDEGGNFLFQVDDKEGQRTFKELVPQLRPDIVFAFNDPQRLLHLCCDGHQRDYRLVFYICFDGFPFMPDQGPSLNKADLIVTMSDFSSRVVLSCLPAIDPAKVAYMYSPADIARFKPVSDDERLSLRQRMLPPWMPQDAFLIGWVGRNQWRKQIWVLYSVIHYLRSGDYTVCRDCGRVSVRRTAPPPACASDELPQRWPEASPSRNVCRHCRSDHIEPAHPLSNVFLWLHMPEEPGQQEWDRSWLENHYEVTPCRDIHYTEGHKLGNFKNPAEMPDLYRLWDCLLYLSGGEGFGLPAWEAMCCGIPVVYTNYSSHGEFLSRANAGLPVGGILQPEKRTCIWRMAADVEQAIEASRKIYFDRALGSALGTNGRAFVRKFTADVQAERWHSMLSRLNSSATS